jgi:hypothetical protein
MKIKKELTEGWGGQTRAQSEIRWHPVLGKEDTGWGVNLKMGWLWGKEACLSPAKGEI